MIDGAFTETAAESDLLFRCNFLIAQDDDAMLVKGRLNLREGRVVEWLREVDATDLCTHAGAGRNNTDGHDVALPPTVIRHISRRSCGHL